ncbi:ABC transporter substrate-binding protein [Mesorhizobium retamae]|uniref:ABC transporter substrate-binding protein n=1 Tax=Mesorhizobium retamae TaxID=2912854 RepID=A0ABS9Q9L6_9HYPH|nr:ABC transporter substrate-binding protein [Mesorhizobium sp. IRAMC:0171]MCG7504097.1 ABC transporter substrate-binding protein [Mesorhizobium sp. IRAMC:0171]
MRITRRNLLEGAAAFGLASAVSRLPAYAQDASAAPEKAELMFGVGGKPLFYYLPLTIAERKGFFEEEGIKATINDFGGGAKSLQALVGGSVDIVTGAYEHTIRMQNKGQDIKAVCELGRFPGICIGVRKDLANEIKTIADLKGKNVGVTAPGSSTALLLQYALIRNGQSADAASIIGVGGGASAVAAIKKGEIAALVHLDPVITRLEVDGDITLLLDTRTEEGTRQLFGGTNPAATVYLQQSFIDANPITTQRVVNAFTKSLAWIHKASADDIADVVPEEFLLGDRELYKTGFEKSRAMYSERGLIAEEGFKSLLEMLKTLDPELANANIAFSQTFDPRFLKTA